MEPKKNDSLLQGKDTPTSPDNKSNKANKFSSTLAHIQSRPLTPENIDYYSSNSLADLIRLTDSVVENYSTEHPSEPAYGKELEDKAFEYFGLDNLGEVLDYVASQELGIRKIDDLIERAENVRRTLVPPNGQMSPIQENEGDFGNKSVILRTKTILFILQNDFDVDVDDPEQISLKTGVMSDNMMRKLSYFMINVPKLKRTILCCDEEGNATYVFDDEGLSASGISPDDLAFFTKDNLNELLQDYPELGRRVVYTNNFAPRMIGLMTNIENGSETSGEGMGLYLYPKAPEGVLSRHLMIQEFGLSYTSIDSAIGRLGEDLGPTSQYRFNGKLGTGYNQEQQEMIRKALEERGLFMDQAPEGILSVYSLSKELRVGEKSINKAVEDLGDSLGETAIYRFGTARTATGYTAEQQEMIRKALEERGLFTEGATEEVKSILGIAEEFGIAHAVVKRVIKDLEETLGTTTKYRFRTTLAAGYNSEQQEMIKQELERRGLISEKATAETLSAGALAKKLGIDHSTLINAIEELGDSLGETHAYKFGGRITTGYNSEQQEMIRQALEEKGLFMDQAPEGILSLYRLSKKLNVGRPALRKLIKELGDSLGETYTYKFGGYRTAIGYTEEQQDMIRQALEERRARKDHQS